MKKKKGHSKQRDKCTRWGGAWLCSTDGVARASRGKEEAEGVGQVQLAQSPGGCTGKPGDGVQRREGLERKRVPR